MITINPSVRILFVEDQDFIRLTVTETLVDAGFDVIDVADGTTALRLIEGRTFDILLTDLHLPGSVDGLDVAHDIRAHWPDVPVIFVTGRPDALEGRWTMRRRDHLITKPYRPRQVLDAIASSLRMTDQIGTPP